MYIFLTIVIVVAAILLTLLVLVQNSKGGGLASGFASGNQVMGAPKTADFLEKTTWGLIAFIVLFAIFAVGAHKHQETSNNHESQVIEQAAEAQQAAQQSAATPAFDDAAEESAE